MSNRELLSDGDHFVFRRCPVRQIHIYEIGICRSPRIFPDKWCDYRICEGFWCNEDMARAATTALNMSYGIFEH